MGFEGLKVDITSRIGFGPGLVGGFDRSYLLQSEYSLLIVTIRF
jgi:hypothetical protein